MGCIQHVHRSGTGRQHLFERGDLAILHDRADGDQQRRASHPGASPLAQGRGRLRVALCSGGGQAFAKSDAGVAADGDEAPRPHAAVIGRAQTGLEDQIKIGALRGRVLQQAQRPPGQQVVEGGVAELLGVETVGHGGTLPDMRTIVICKIGGSRATELSRRTPRFRGSAR